MMPALDTPLNSQQQAIARRFVPLARALSRAHGGGDDVLSEMYFALVRSASRWQPQPGRDGFAKYTRMKLGFAAIDRLRRVSPLESTRPATVSLESLDPEEGPFDEGPAPNDAVEEEETLDWWLQFLPSRLAYVTRAIYFHGLKPTDISHELGVSRNTVWRMHRQALERLHTVAVITVQLRGEYSDDEIASLLSCLRDNDAESTPGGQSC